MPNPETASAKIEQIVIEHLRREDNSRFWNWEAFGEEELLRGG